MVRLSHDEALVLFEWLSRTDELTNDFGDLVEDQAEQRALWNLTCLLEWVLVEPFRPRMTHRGRRGRASDPEWQQRNRLTRSAARMRAEHVDRLTDTLSNLPAKIGAPILAAWNTKEDLLELHRLATTIETWWPEILAFLHTGITKRRLRRHQPRHQNRRPRCLRIPQPREPAATHPHRHNPPPPRTPQPRLTSKSPYAGQPLQGQGISRRCATALQAPGCRAGQGSARIHAPHPYHGLVAPLAPWLLALPTHASFRLDLLKVTR